VTDPVQKLIDAVSRAPEAQAREGRPGDPQLSALCQFLVQRYLQSDSVLVDFGAGNGVLAQSLSEIWPPGQPMLEYWAVDLSEILDKLSLPNRVHNNSRKYVADELYSSVLPKQGKRIAVVVIRNTLHEMNIEQTARLLNSLHLYLKPESHIYVQEMSELRIPERGNAPWSRDLLEECLQKAGFNIWGFDLRSHSGILWYAIICQRRERETSYADCLESVVSSRKTQADRILTRLMQLTKSPQNSDELVALEHEYSCISVQLRAATPTSLPESHEPRLEAMRIPTRVPVEEHLEFVCPVASSVSSKTGLIAVISSKQLLDFPKFSLRPPRNFVSEVIPIVCSSKVTQILMH